MGLFGGLFGSKTETQSVPQYVTDLGMDAAALARETNARGYIPYYGAETAAFTPMQLASMQGANLQASALGLPTAPMSIPTATDYGGGLQGYNSAGIMEDALARLKSANPDVYSMLMKLKEMQQPERAPMSPAMRLARIIMGGNDGEGTGVAAAASAARSGAGTGGGGMFGYTSGRDMFDGGGKGASGSTFAGGPFSGRLNNLGITPRSR